MEKSSLTWIEFYSEFATKLLQYKHNRKELLKKLIDIYHENGMKFPKMESDGIVIDIDPFTLFGLFNKGITTRNRILILKGIAKSFKIESKIPTDFDGIPILNNRRSTFFNFKNERQRDDIDNLWDIFEEAIIYADNPFQRDHSNFVTFYDKVVSQSGVKWNITMGLYWIRSHAFVNLDSRNRDFLVLEKLINEKTLEKIENLKRLPNGKEYLELCNELTNTLNSEDIGYHSFPELSLAAWKATKQKVDQVELEACNITYWPTLEEYNPNLTKDNWVVFLKEDRKKYPSTIEMLKAFLELGGEATYKRIGELLGEHTSSCISKGKALGIRAKKYFALPACMYENIECFFPISFMGRSVIEDGHQLYAWKLRPELKEALESMNLGELSTSHNCKTDIHKNTILYGPPGTGKTYNTVFYAVAIIENQKLQSVMDEDYTDVLERYNAYKSEGLIELTTFHQSYGYEEFIEGIRPIMNTSDEEHKDIQYEIVPGIFKKFCDKAGQPIVKQRQKNLKLNSSPSIWKVSLEKTGDNPTRVECMEKGHIRIGYDSYGENIISDMHFKEGGKNVLNAFIYKMKIGDIVLSCYSATTIDAIGVVTGEYEWHDEYDYYKRLRKVNWIAKNLREDITDINNGMTMTLSTVYQLNIALSDVMNIVARNASDITEIEKKKNYVFIIDEINRGNISKIFGELITLIEPSKRFGQSEGMKVKLPYSQQLFGVPDNIFLIGTMNTADRSIAAIDTALRRRFNFKEMLPDIEVLEGIYVDDISIKDIMCKINKRISVFYDREHTIGHAYFLPLKTNPTIEALADIFKNTIIPLLQEYFYEDYEKIRLVLGDNNKINRNEQFIIKIENNYNQLFGNIDYQFDESFTYEVNNVAFENIEAYKQI